MAYASRGLARGAAKSRGRRQLAVTTWLGAGALTLGVGAALVGAAGAAQADTGGDHAAGPTASGKPNAGPSAGPKIPTSAHGSVITAAASIKRVSVTAPATALLATPAGALPLRTAAASQPSVSPAAAVRSTTKLAASAARTVPVSAIKPVASAVQAEPASTISAAASAAQADPATAAQTFSTPFGPVTLTGSVTAPPIGTSGAVAVSVSAKTPIGNANFSLSGAVSYDPGLNQVTLTKGAAVLPSSIAFLLDAFSPGIAGALSMANTATTFFAAVQHGNIAKAAQVFFSAPFTFTNAVLFGHQTITIPLTLQPGTTVVLSIPIGGTFSSLITPSLTIPSFSFFDENNQVTYQVNASTFPLTGMQISGLLPALLKGIGL